MVVETEKTMAITIATVTTRVTKDDDKGIQRGEQLADRASELSHYADKAYRLVHTHVLTGVDFDTFVDTLTRETDA
jgi:hypothetical protein